MKKRVMFYCQHVLGMGHLIRSMEIVRGLNDFDVCFLNGGEIIDGFESPASVKVVNLPPIKSDEGFKAIQGSDGSDNFEGLKSERTLQLLSDFDQFDPDVVIIELFPFGRKNFAFELVPLLARIRLSKKSVKVVCSLRDILVSKSDPIKHEARVCDLMNRYFDLLLIHADPQFQRLEETFSRLDDLVPDVKYTGYVAQPVPTDDLSTEELELVSGGPGSFILGSIGGGRVGHELLQALISASLILEKTLSHRVLIFTGPYISDDQFQSLQDMVEDRPCIHLRKYTSEFLSYMKKADLSVSMAGYNTCMNILTTGVRALVLPFTGNQNNEQSIRAEKLESLGVLSLIRPDELRPALLAEKMSRLLKAVPTPSPLDIRGVEQTVLALKEMIDEKPTQDQSAETANKSSGTGDPFSIFESALRPRIEQLQREDQEVNIFLRDDDIDEDEDTLRSLFDLSLSTGVPVNLEIMPGKLTEAGIKLLKNHKRFHPALVEFNQHGWQHLNHEKEGRKCEFGVSRSFDQQYEDISRGKAYLEEVFDERFFPVFTPPWNRCTDDTLKALSQLGFRVFSKDKGKHPITGYSFQEISTTLDLYRWKGNPAMKSPEEISELLLAQMGSIDPIGLLLHHKVMGDVEFRVFDQLLNVLRGYSNVKFHTFESLLALSTEKEEG